MYYSLNIQYLETPINVCSKRFVIYTFYKTGFIFKTNFKGFKFILSKRIFIELLVRQTKR